jgi:hypothetical protein
MDPATSYAGQKMRIEDRDGRELTPGDPDVRSRASSITSLTLSKTIPRSKRRAKMGLRDLRLTEAIYASARV